MEKKGETKFKENEKETEHLYGISVIYFYCKIVNQVRACLNCDDEE